MLLRIEPGKDDVDRFEAGVDPRRVTLLEDQRHDNRLHPRRAALRRCAHEDVPRPTDEPVPPPVVHDHVAVLVLDRAGHWLGHGRDCGRCLTTPLPGPDNTKSGFRSGNAGPTTTLCGFGAGSGAWRSSFSRA